jgi:hypothetical protein
MHDKLLESAPGISAPWSVKSVDFDGAAKRLTVLIDFAPATRVGVPGQPGVHPVRDTVAKDYRHLNFFQHECHLRVRTPRVMLPDGSVRLVEQEFAGRLAGFTLLFEALILMLAQRIPFAAAARIVDESSYRVMCSDARMSTCRKYAIVPTLAAQWTVDKRAVLAAERELKQRRPAVRHLRKVVGVAPGDRYAQPAAGLQRP